MNQISLLIHKFSCKNKANLRFFSYYKGATKKFYKNATIQCIPGNIIDGFAIQVDKKTIKTPLRNILSCPSKQLALAAAHEWDSQNGAIDLYTMPLTKICYAVIDNPNNFTNEELIDEILRFLNTDTVCSLSVEPGTLVELQNQRWTPIRDWFNKRYQVIVNYSQELFATSQSEETMVTLKKHLLQMNNWQLNGLVAAVRSTQSFIICMAVLEKEVSIEDAVMLSRLEMEYQIERWGNFQQVHDLDKYIHQMSIAAAMLVYNLTAS